MQLTGIHNKARYNEVAIEINNVARGLRENTKNLCRVLKDNPNIQGNLSKIHKDRDFFISLFDNFIGDLNINNHQLFKSRILTELEKQNELHKKRQLEKETAFNAKQL